MTDEKGKNTRSKIAAASMAGAIVGAGVGAATVMVLKDEKKRKKIGQTVKNVQNYAQNKMKEANKKMDNKVQEKMDDMEEKSRAKAKESKEN